VRATFFALGFFAACASAATPRFHVEAELELPRIYVGGETILRVRLLRAPGVPYGVLRPPALGDAAEVWSLRPASWYQIQREGTPWDVHERIYLLVPRRGGTLTIASTEIEGPLRRQAMPDEMRALRGPKLELEVRPVPAGASEPWLPARRITLEESWSHDPASVPAGVAITRTVTLRADGLPAQRLPQIEMAAQPKLRVHHDRPDLATEHRETGTIGRLTQRIVLVPLDDTEVALPALGVQWWDVAGDAPRTATLPARTLRLLAARTPAGIAAAPDVSLTTVRIIAAALALLMAAGLWWRARKEPARDARRKLREACRANDPYAARDALVLWRNAALPGPGSLLVQDIGQHWDAAAQAQLRALDAALYGRRGWNGKEFWKCIRVRLRKTELRNAPARSPPFFRLQESER
jgi:hypothetical protein